MRANQLTENEYDSIKQMTNSTSWTLKTIAKMRKRSYTVVRQVNSSRDYLDYKVKYYKDYKPSFKERVLSWIK